MNIIQGTHQKAISKHSTYDNGKSQGPPFQPSGPSQKEKASNFNILSKIPLTVWVGLLLIVIPTLCCCGCIYFCCCRKSNNNKRQNSNDENVDPEEPQHNNQDKRSGLRNLLSGINIGAAGAMLMNCIQNRNNNRGNNLSNNNSGGAYPNNYNPGIKQNKNEYKERVVEDSGGGGNW